MTFRPEDGPDNVGLAEPFNKNSIDRQSALLRAHGIIPAIHASLAGMIEEELPPEAKGKDWYTPMDAHMKKIAIEHPILAGHTMVKPNYQNAEVLDYLAGTFALLTHQTGYGYYWLDNWDEKDRATYTRVYQAVRDGADREGDRPIIRSGAGPAKVGLEDILAPGPDVQDAWHYVQEIFDHRVIAPFVHDCPNAYKIGFDDFNMNQPFSRDQARFLVSLYALAGIEITITEGEFFKTLPERIAILQKALPLPVTGPLQAVARAGSRRRRK